MQVAKKHMKRSSKSLMVQDMQILLSFTSCLLGWLLQTNTKVLAKKMEKLECLCIADENAKGPGPMGSSMAAP